MLPRTNPIPSGRPTFLGAPRTDDLDLLDADVAVAGIPYTTPYDLASSRSPSSTASETVREQSQRLAARISHYDFDLGGDLFAGRDVRITDCGDVCAVPGLYEENAHNATAVVGAMLDRGTLPIVLGGDHAASIPSIRARATHGPVCVVHLGADLDWQDQVNGVRSGAPSTMRRVSELPCVTSMMQIGVRASGSARPRDVDDARTFGSILVSAEELHEAGVPSILRLVPPAARYYVSLDVGALDPAIAPGVERPSFGGLTYFEVTNLLKGIAAKAPVVGFDLVGISPAKDLHGITSLLGSRLILNLVGALAHTGRVQTLEDGTGRGWDRGAATGRDRVDTAGGRR